MSGILPDSDPIAEDARRLVARLAMLDARDLANRAFTHANELRQLGGTFAEIAADCFDAHAAELREMERAYAAEAGALEDGL